MPSSNMNNASTLSPRKQFENAVRDLSAHDVHHRHRRNKSISLKYNPYELQHISSLRVSPRQKSSCPASPITLSQTSKEPEFGIEERKVWSNKSPIGNVHRNQSSKFDVYEEPSPSPSLSKRLRNELPPFHPQRKGDTEEDGRPKTRRGPAGRSEFVAPTKDQERDDAQAESVRAAKFVEGTMTSRSGGVSSAWSESEYATSSSEAEETDSDATPRAAQKRRSSSIDLRDFQPPTLSSSAIKRTIFGRRENKNKNEKKQPETRKETKQIGDGEVEKPKRRLRKSISKLQFLGDKMKLFGSSNHDLREQTTENMNRSFLDDKSVLDERKRKAEKLYAQQFGLKKQRDNDGLANITSSPEPPNLEEFGGNQKYDSSTVRQRGGIPHSRRTSTGSIHTLSTLSRRESINEHDIRKRPTRRELEKENQQLRALLQESQVVKESTVGYNSEPESIPPVPTVPPLRIRKSLPPVPDDQTNNIANFIISQSYHEPAPPVPPQHPDRRSVLGNVSNNRSRRTRRESFGIVTEAAPDSHDGTNDRTNPMQNPPKLVPTQSTKSGSVVPRRSIPALPRSVSVIVEEPENENDEKKRSLRSRTVAVGKENSPMMSHPNQNSAHGEQWQWPEDVF